MEIRNIAVVEMGMEFVLTQLDFGRSRTCQTDKFLNHPVAVAFREVAMVRKKQHRPAAQAGPLRTTELQGRKVQTAIPLRRSKYQIFPAHPPDRRAAMEAWITRYGIGIEDATVWDDEGNLLDGWEREDICAKKGTTPPRVVKHFASEADKFRYVLAANASRRPNLNRKQKREVIAAYLRGDPAVADNLLGQTLGVSKNTVLAVRRRLEASGWIGKVHKTRGKDGKLRPVRYTKRIITNSPSEFEKAQAIVGDLPDNCAGKTLDIITARRRADRNRNKQERDSRRPIVPSPDDAIRLYHCRFQELEQAAGLKPSSVKAVLTDIPYRKAWSSQAADLGEFAARVLVPGGLLLVMTGIQNVDSVLAGLGRHLDLKVKLEAFWKADGGTPCYLDNAGVVVSCSKPIWVYSKGPFTRKGRFGTPIGPFAREKGWHPHQQPLELFAHLVRQFTDPGDLVVDPCGGGFTTALACYLLGRRCISCDIDGRAVMRGMERLAKAMRGEPDRP